MPTETPLFDALVAEAKTRFLSYDGPDTFPDTEAPGKLTSYTIWHAVDDVMKNLDQARLLALLGEDPTWYTVSDIFKSRQPPAWVLLKLALGQPINWPSNEQRAEIIALLTDPDGDMLQELDEALSDALRSDPEVKAEDERRWALTGRGDED